MLESCVIPGAHSYVLGSLPSGLIMIRLSGTCLALLPTTATAASPVYLAVFAHFRSPSFLVSVTAAFVLPALAFLIKEPNAVALMPFLCVLLSLAFVKHHENIRRRLSGTESRFLQK